MLLATRSWLPLPSSPMPVWRIVNAPATTFWANIATNGAGRWVALGRGSLPGGSTTVVPVAVSENNGESWLLYSVNVYGLTFDRLIWDATTGLFVAISKYGVWTSPLGTVWTQQTMPVSPSPTTGYYTGASVGGAIVALGQTHAAVSTSGTTWGQQPLPFNSYWTDVRTSGPVTIAFGNDMPCRVARRDTNGTVWASGSLLPGAVWRADVAFGKFYGLGSSGAEIYRSSAADVWETLIPPAAILLPVSASGPAGMVVVGRSYKSLLSIDGNSFTDLADVPAPYYCNDIAVSDSRYIAVVYDKDGASYGYQTSKFLILDMPAPANPPPTWVTTSPLTDAEWETPYLQALLATSDSPPVVYSLLVGGLAPGLTLTGNQITGSPHPAPSAPVWTTAVGSLGAATQGGNFSNTLAATGADSFAIKSGMLPWGIALAPDTGALAGTLAVIGGAEDNPGTPPTWATAAGSLGTVRETSNGISFPVSMALTATGAANFHIVGGVLPWGLVMAKDTGAITGFARDVGGATWEPDIAITWSAPASSSLGSFARGASVGTIAQATSSAGTFSVIGGVLPWGLMLVRGTGVISGTVSTENTPGVYSFTIVSAAITGESFGQRIYSITIT